MGKLTYSMSVSLDGFVNGPDGAMDWVIVDEELHRAFNDEARTCAVDIYGRRMYELMTAYWPTAGDDPTATPAELDFAAIWARTPKVVASTTLAQVGFGARLLGRDVVAEVRRLKASIDGNLGVGGPTVAATLLRAGLVDEITMYVNPVIVGGGTPFLPPDLRPSLRLLDTRRFGAGVVMLRYAVS
jgi:dihydrofolate reductase